MALHLLHTYDLNKIEHVCVRLGQRSKIWHVLLEEQMLCMKSHRSS